MEVDGDDRLVGFEEKPSEPASTLVATATYLYHRAHVPLVGRYLADGNPPDQPGRLDCLAVSRRSRCTATASTGEWYDIGSPEQLLEADNRWRERLGLPQRDEYSTLS